MSHFPYSIPESRPLSEQERVIVRHLLLHTAPDRVDELERLSVVERCGCGRCPTILFVPHDETTENRNRIVADFVGGENSTVGVIVWERDGVLAELEAWSLDGNDVTSWPAVSSLRPFTRPV